MIVDANIRATPEALEELIDLYGGLRQAWYEVEKSCACRIRMRKRGRRKTIGLPAEPERTTEPMPARMPKWPSFNGALDGTQQT